MVDAAKCEKCFDLAFQLYGQCNVLNRDREPLPVSPLRKLAFKYQQIYGVVVAVALSMLSFSLFLSLSFSAYISIFCVSGILQCSCSRRR